MHAQCFATCYMGLFEGGYLNHFNRFSKYLLMEQCGALCWRLPVVVLVERETNFVIHT